MTVDKKILPKIQLKTKLTKAHPIFVKNTVAVLLLVVKVAAPPINTKDMGKNVKNIKIAKNLQKGSLTVIVVFFKRREI